MSGSPTAAPYEASFVADVTVPDGATFSGGAEFSKVWRMRNHGDLAWPKGTNVVFVGGSRMTRTSQFAVQGDLSPGRDVNIEVKMNAPKSPGKYRSIWRLETPENKAFGVIMWCEIVVAAAKVEQHSLVVPNSQLATPPISPAATPAPNLPVTPPTNSHTSLPATLPTKLHVDLPVDLPADLPADSPVSPLTTLPVETDLSVEAAPEKAVLSTLGALSITRIQRDFTPVFGILLALVMTLSTLLS